MNYQVVHVDGEITFQHDARSKRAAVGLLTSRHELRLNGDAAWRMSDAPADYMEAMLDAIVAFRISVRRTIAVRMPDCIEVLVFLKELRRPQVDHAFPCARHGIGRRAATSGFSFAQPRPPEPQPPT